MPVVPRRADRASTSAATRHRNVTSRSWRDPRALESRRGFRAAAARAGTRRRSARVSYSRVIMSLGGDPEVAIDRTIAAR